MPTAREMLACSDAAGAAWARFDAAWYLRTYPHVRDGLATLDDAAVLAYYRDFGQQQGHSPNPLFDEAFFLSSEPGAAERVRAGEAESGFDVYCRSGGRQLRPHWLFDEAQYRRGNPDLADATLAAHGLVNGYDHFLRHGAREGRIGSAFFDPAVYRAGLGEEDGGQAEAAGWFVDFVHRLHRRDGSQGATSVYFDPVWYRQRYPAVAAAVAEGLYLSALHHYMTNDTPEQFDPLPEFSEAAYLALHPDVAAAVAAGAVRNGYEHFLSHGVFELRAPNEALDLQYYLTAHRAVRTALHYGGVRDAFAHYLTVGRAQGLLATPPPAERFTEAQASTVLGLRARALPSLLARRKLDFAFDGEAVLSAVMVVRDGLALTLQTLASLRANFAGAIELIVIDCGSADGTRQIERYVRGATLLRFETDIGPASGRAAALQGVSAPIVLFLGSGVELAPGAVEAALARLADDPTVGAVGGKVVGAHGRLHEAGGIVWADGGVMSYMRDASPDAPEANFMRDVDFCSTVFLMVRETATRTLDSFGAEVAVGIYWDVELCAAVAEAGARVVYDPSIVLHRAADAAPADPPAADPNAARERFVQGHEAYLRARRAGDVRAVVFARTTEAGAERRRVLFIDAAVPSRGLDAHFARSCELIDAMTRMGLGVTVFPCEAAGGEVAAMLADMPETVEVMHDLTLADLPGFLRQRVGYYDIAWVAVTSDGAAVWSILERAAVPRIVFDDPNKTPVGYGRGPAATARGFEDRAGLLFCDRLQGEGTPAYDALCRFVDSVLPLVQQALAWETQLTIVADAPDAGMLDRFRQHARIVVRCPPVDWVPLYGAHRIVVIPEPAADGAVYRLLEAASYGVPVVAGEALCERSQWRDGVELLAAPAADAARFAAQIVALYRDKALWYRLREAALARLVAEHGPERTVQALRALLG